MKSHSRTSSYSYSFNRELLIVSRHFWQLNDEWRIDPSTVFLTFDIDQLGPVKICQYQCHWNDSLRTADMFLVVAFLPPERSDDRKYGCWRIFPILAMSKVEKTVEKVYLASILPVCLH